MDELYKENILDHYRNPRNAGTLKQPTHSHTEHNPLCGDVVRIDLQVSDDNVVEQVAFQGKGCAISQASASILTEMLTGKTLEAVKQIGKEEVLDSLGLKIGPVRLKCALLPLKTLKMAVYGLPEENWLVEENW